MVQTCGHTEVIAAAKGVDSKHRSVGLELLTKLGVNIHAAPARTTSHKAASQALTSLSVGAPQQLLRPQDEAPVLRLHSVRMASASCSRARTETR